MTRTSTIRRSILRRLHPGVRDQRLRASRHDERSAGTDESGAVLVLALVFLVVVSVIVGALTTWTTNDLQNSNNFKQSAAVTDSATDAVNLAVANMRYAPMLYTVNAGVSTSLTLNASPPNSCWGSGPGQPSQAFNMNVYCSTVWNPASLNSRQVTISACPMPSTPAGSASWSVAQTTCPLKPFLQANVTFGDYPIGLVSKPNPNPIPCVAYCGSTMIINGWNWHPLVPQVSTVTGLSGNVQGGQPITISGSGFTSNAKVNFVISDPVAQLQTTLTQTVQQVVPATNVIVHTDTQTITASAPAVTTLANYYVTVTTPGGGTSPVNPSALFVYNATAPTVASAGVTPNAGAVLHGTTITITGTGFINGATVSMIQESGGSPVSPLNQVQATAVQVVSGTQITAITYPVTAGGTYFVVVTTSAGASQNSAVFTFS
jgi:hypothetical protein